MTNPSNVEVSEFYKGSDKLDLDALSILQWNADGLSTKVVELRERLVAENIDVCVIQETKLKHDLVSPKIYGYKTILRADRKGTISGGGLLIYAKETIVVENI